MIGDITMKNCILIFLSIVYTFIYSQSCTHYIRLTDTFGDGWTGNRVSVSVNGFTVLSNITLTSGYGPVTYSFNAPNGAIIRVWRSVTGSWAAECRTQVLTSSLVPLTGVISTTTGGTSFGGTTCIASCVTALPANDLVCNAILISCGQTVSGTTFSATTSGYGELGTCGVVQSYPGVWYKVTGNGQIMTASLCATAWDSKISVFSGTCSSLTCIGGNDDAGPACAGTSASCSWTSVNAVTYWILVHGYSSNSTFTLSLNCIMPPIPGPCINSTAYGTQFMPVFQGAPYETIYCQYAGEYSTWWNAIANTPYIITSTVPTDWITIRRGTFNGPIVAFGTQPLSFTPTITGTLYMHVNTNSLCGTASSCRNISVSRISALPVELLYFDGEKKQSSNYLYWATASEHNSSHFVVEKSEDGYNWQQIGQLPSAINSTQELHYDLTDNDVSPIYNYYRLMQYDIDGAFKQYGPIAINNKQNSYKIIKRINLAGQEVNESATGIIIEIYENGDIIKTVK